MKDFSLRKKTYTAMMGALTAAGALMVIPLQPVPITLQTLFTGLSGVLLGAAGGALSQVVYVILGLIGLPIFAGGRAGLGTLLGPSGGYLIGFIMGAWLTGFLVERRRDPGLVWIILALMLGSILIYALGSLQLMLVAHLSLTKAVLAGVIPFIPGDMLKILAAGLLAYKLRGFVKV